MVITHRYGCVSELAAEETSQVWIGKMPAVDVASPVGWNDALVAGYAVRLLEGDSPEDCLRFGLACGAANLISYGAGVLSCADAERFVDMVELEGVPAGSEE